MATMEDRLFPKPADLLLVEIAVRIQLSPRRHRQATERYQTVAEWLERDRSPLKDRVSQLYPQGSMAIGATILSRDSEDRYDIDIAAELATSQDSSPKAILDTLYQAVKGDPSLPIFRHDTPAQPVRHDQIRGDASRPDSDGSEAEYSRARKLDFREQKGNPDRRETVDSQPLRFRGVVQ